MDKTIPSFGEVVACGEERSRRAAGCRPVRSARLLVFVFGGACETLSIKRRSRLSALAVKSVAPRTGCRRASRSGMEGVQAGNLPQSASNQARFLETEVAAL